MLTKRKLNKAPDGALSFIETKFILLSEQGAIAVLCHLGMSISQALHYPSFV